MRKSSNAFVYHHLIISLIYHVRYTIFFFFFRLLTPLVMRGLT